MESNKRVVLITGAGSLEGIGSGIAAAFAKNDHIVYIGDIDDKSSQVVVKALKEKGAEIYSVQLDVTKKEMAKNVVDKIISNHGKIDILVNNAGVSRPSSILDISEDEFKFIFDVNMKGTFNMTQAVLPAMIAEKYGRIINLGSVSAKRGGGVFGGAHYSAAKAGVMGFAKAVAREVAPYGITVNSVAPGLIGTRITGDLLNDPKMKKQIISGIPVGRIGTIEDVAEAVLFLSSEKSGYITGEEIDINGGSHMD